MIQAVNIKEIAYSKVKEMNCYLVDIKVSKNNDIKVTFDKKIRGVAPGQSAVFYKDNLCLGGGVIEGRNNDL